MGLIKTTKQDNGSFKLEITYGGAEAPFGGIDTSAPPAYIDPKCFTQADGFFVVDNKLCVGSWQKILGLTLFGGQTGVQLLGAGTFFNSIYNQLNYVIGYMSAPFSGPPSGVGYTFYITSWDPSNTSIVHNDTLPITLYDAATTAVAASITLDIIQSNSVLGPTTGFDGLITSVNGSGGITGLSLVSGGAGWVIGMQATIVEPGNPSGVGAVLTVTGVSGGAITTFTFTPGMGYTASSVATYPSELKLNISGNIYTVPTYLGPTKQTAVADMVTAINAVPDPNVTASASLDGYQLILTANTAGSAGNSITVQDISINGNILAPPPLYFSCVLQRHLEGGLDSATNVLAPRSFGLASITAVGGTVYFANLGPMILQYSGPGTFTTNTMYQGVNVIKKFAGSLLGLGLVNQLGVLTQNQDMILVWSASTDLMEWAPVTVAGDVTGAGFEQLADVDDALTGLIVSNNTAFIIRQQGVSYATATGNGTEPYSVAHISLGDSGEGGQVPSLICQYDQMGCYVGNTNIYGCSNTPSPIGEKIKNAFIAFLASLPDPIPSAISAQASYLMSANACGIQMGGTEDVFFAFMLGQDVYYYNATNGTWMHISYNLPSAPLEIAQGLLCTLSNSSLQSSNQSFKQSLMTLVASDYDTVAGATINPVLYTLLEGMPGTGISNLPTITFPVEEVMFGRFINLESIYFEIEPCNPGSSVGQYLIIQFNINGVLFAETTVGHSIAPLGTVPVAYQAFAVAGGAVNFVSPQLSISFQFVGIVGSFNLRFTKIAMFGSFDPNQGPTS